MRIFITQIVLLDRRRTNELLKGKLCLPRGSLRKLGGLQKAKANVKLPRLSKEWAQMNVQLIID